MKPHARMVLLVLMLIGGGIAPGGARPPIQAASPPQPTVPGSSCAPPLEVVSSPNHPGINGINGLAAVGPDDIWAVGSYTGVGIARPLIQHWDGAAWTEVPSAVVTRTAWLNTVAATGTGDVWAVGAVGNAHDANLRSPL